MNKRSGFTIVELLVVIVVIGVLAAITIVSYSGVSNQAIIASVKSDLSNSTRTLKLFHVEQGSYPTTVSTNCAANPDTTTNKCLKLSNGNEIESYSRPTSQSFILAIKNGNNIWEITDNSEAVSVIPQALTAVATPTGVVEEGSTLTVGATTPVGAAATATFQWQRADNNTFTTNITDIPSATSSTYSLTASEVNKYIRIKVTGTSRFPGTIYSAGVGAVTNPWLNGRTGSPLDGKKVYNQDMSASTYQWKTSMTDCVSQQCTVTGPVAETYVGYTGKDVLVSDNNVSFSDYPARNACKVVGGRLPTIAEMKEMYAYKSSYNNNFQALGSYWSATESNAGSAHTVAFGASGSVSDNIKTGGGYVRCVR